MPLTPLHLAPASALFLTSPHRWSFAGLLVGSVIPDIEIPFLYLSGLEMQTGHGPLHSVLGALTFGVVLAVLGAYFVYPSLMNWWEGKFGSRYSHFGGADVTELGSLPMVVSSAFAGVLTHLSLDYLTHTTMPYLWPFEPPVATFSFARDFYWLVIVNVILLVVLAEILIRYLGRTEKAGLETARSP